MKSKKVINHLKGDIKTFKKEAAEDRELIKSLKAKPKKKKHSRKKVAKKKTKSGHKKFERVLKEYKEGKLHSGSKKGPKVRKKSQALAIAFKYDRKADNTAKGDHLKKKKK